MRIKELDGVRGIAVLMVLVWHYVAVQVNLPNTSIASFVFNSLISVFWSGVDLFFVLSGFLIGGIIYDNRKRKNFIKYFWLHRCCRILPALAVLLISCLFFSIILNANSYAWLFHDMMPWWSYLSFTQNIMMGVEGTFGAHFLGVTWSLAVEEQFYLLAPLLAICLSGRSYVSAIISLVIIAVFLRLVFPGFHGYVNMVFRMDSLLLGSLVAIAYRNEVIWKVLKNSGLKMIVISAMVLCIPWLIIACLVAMGNSQEAKNIYHGIKFLWFSLAYSVLLLAVLIYQGSVFTKILRTSFLMFWGKIAYGLYLYHQAVSGLMHGFFRSGSIPAIIDIYSASITITSLILVVLLALFSYKYIELPFLNYGRQYRY